MSDDSKDYQIGYYDSDEVYHIEYGLYTLTAAKAARDRLGKIYQNRRYEYFNIYDD